MILKRFMGLVTKKRPLTQGDATFFIGTRFYVLGQDRRPLAEDVITLKRTLKPNMPDGSTKAFSLLAIAQDSTSWLLHLARSLTHVSRVHIKF